MLASRARLAIGALERAGGGEAVFHERREIGIENAISNVVRVGRVARLPGRRRLRHGAL